jgi:hypothetical protein
VAAITAASHGLAVRVRGCVLVVVLVVRFIG